MFEKMNFSKINLLCILGIAKYDVSSKQECQSTKSKHLTETFFFLLFVVGFLNIKSQKFECYKKLNWSSCTHPKANLLFIYFKTHKNNKISQSHFKARIAPSNNSGSLLSDCENKAQRFFVDFL